MIIQWNQTHSEYPREACFHQLFQAQAERTPDAVAVEDTNARLSYAQLNLRANVLAHHLQTLGVGPEILVGVCLETSVDALVTLLAVLKAGGAFVPLDPAYPRERLGFMMRDSRMRVLITHSQLEPRLAKGSAHTLCIDQPQASSADTISNLASGARSHNLAYVIYTSGSTGRPKGVMVPHRGLVNYLVWARDAYQVQQGTGAPVHSSLAFDLTITGLFLPLLAGQRVHMIPAQSNLSALADVLRRPEHFSLVKITPAHLQMLCAQLADDDAAAATRLFVVGGEALFGRSLGFWEKCAPQAILVNEYGPTETVVGCCAYFVPQKRDLEGPVPIGRPIANTQLYVLDPNLEPVAIGEPGELYIAGDGVARGYLNLPELTAAKFLPNPFVSEDPRASTMMFRSGDLVRYRADGNLEYLGRLDDQIKLRGFRVEPVEIEAALLTHPAISGVAVLARSTAQGDQQLVAYFVHDDEGDAPSPSALRKHLQHSLPEYMIPSVFVALTKFPLTDNGKIDRPALVAMEDAIQQPYVAPRTETERRVAEIWAQMFQLPAIGLHDSFFEMGGHSLLAVRLVTQMNHAFESDLDAVTLLEHPTVETISEALQRENPETLEPKLVQLRHGGTRAPVFFLNPPFDFNSLARQIDDRPVYATHGPWSPELLRASARLDSSEFPTVAQMAAVHSEMIRRCLTSACVLAGYSYGAVLAFEVSHQLRRAGIAVDAVLLFDAEMRIPDWERRKRRARFHFANLWQQGSAYVFRTARRRREVRSVARANTVQAPENNLATAEARWEAIDRIWRHALKRYRPRRAASRGILLWAHETWYDPSQNYDGTLGWSRLFKGGTEIISVPGDHHSMWKEPQLAALCRSWKSALEKLPAPAAK